MSICCATGLETHGSGSEPLDIVAVPLFESVVVQKPKCLRQYSKNGRVATVVEEKGSQGQTNESMAVTVSNVDAHRA